MISYVPESNTVFVSSVPAIAKKDKDYIGLNYCCVIRQYRTAINPNKHVATGEIAVKNHGMLQFSIR
jgi:hypothetical protein